MVLVAVLVSVVVLKATIPASSVIKIGVISPMSGPAASMGEEVANTINLANTTSVALTFEDDQCDAKKALSAYQKLKSEDVHVFYVTCSGSVLALAPLAKQDGNLIVTAYAGSSEIRATGDEVIRFIPDGVSVAKAMAEYVSKLPAQSRIGLLYEEQDYAKSVALTLQNILGTRIINEEAYVADDTSFRTQITKLKGAHIDVLLYIPTSDKAEKIVFQQMQTLAYTPHVVGDVNVCGYPINPKDFGITTATCFNAEFLNETAGYKQFIVAYKSRYGIDPSAAFYDAVTYDVVSLIEKFSRANRKSDFVPALKKYFLSGVTGEMSTYQFTQNGEVIADQYLKIVEK